MLAILILLMASLSYAIPFEEDNTTSATTLPVFQVQEGKFQRTGIVSEPLRLEIAVDSSYIIGPGDYFEILSPKGFDVVQVSPEGNVSIPSCGMVYVDKLPLNAVKDTLMKLLVSKYDERYVKIQLVRTKKMSISVLGAVHNPSRTSVEQQTRVNAAIMQCGGFTSLSDKKNIKVIRGNDTLAVDFIKFETNGVGDINIMLKPDDVVYVPYITAESSISIETPASNYSIPYVEGRTLGEYLDKTPGIGEIKAKWVKIKKPDGAIDTYEYSSARDLRLLPKTQVELWQNDPYIYVGGAVAVVGKALYSPHLHAIDYIAMSGVTIITGSWSRVTRIRDGITESIDPYKDEILPGDYIEIPRSIYETVKDVTLFLASLLSVVATAIIITSY